MRILIFIAILGPLLQCSPPKFATRHFQAEDFSTASILRKNVAVAVIGLGEVTGYEKGFSKVYGTKADFSEALLDSCVTKLNATSVPAKATELTAKQKATFAKEINSFKLDWEVIPDEVREMAVETCAREGTEYLMVVTRWQVSGKWESRPGSPVTSATGPMRMGGSSNAKMCYVTLEGAVLDTHGRVCYYGEARGQAEVSFFAFKTALKSGVADGVSKLSLLLTGRMPAENISF